MRQEPGDELRRLQVLLQYIPKSSLFSFQSIRNVQQLSQEPGEQMRQDPGDELRRLQVLLQYIPKSSLFSLQSIRNVQQLSQEPGARSTVEAGARR